MIKTGYVETVYDSTAEIRIKRDSACGDNCGNCSGCNLMVTVSAKNTVNANKGDLVEIEMPSNSVLGAAFITYMIPLVILIVGYAIGGCIFNTEIKSILTAIAFFIISVAGVCVYSRVHKEKYSIKITKILNNQP